MRSWLSICMFALVTALPGCVVYEPVPVGPNPQQRFERSWNAAAGAMADQGVTIESQDFGSGVVAGRRGGIQIVARVSTMPDGSIQVRFDQSGATDEDPNLIQRVSRSYDRRMGR